MPDPINHIIHSRSLCLKDTIALAVMIPHMIEYHSPYEIHKGKVQIP